jgi:integrase/recombinase XerC
MNVNETDDGFAQLTRIDAARLLLEKIGVSPADLLRTSSETRDIPLLADYIPRVSEAVSSGTRRVYSPYWNRVLKVWGPRPLTDVTALDVSQLSEQMKARAVERRNGRGGRSAAEHMIAALRCVYKYAAADGIIAEAENPAPPERRGERCPPAAAAQPAGPGGCGVRVRPDRRLGPGRRPARSSPRWASAAVTG